MSSSTDAALVRGRVLADLVPGALVRDLALVGAFAASIGLMAQVAIPLGFTPVPITGQTLAVLLGAAALGTWRAGAGASLYLALGLAGVPWFTWAGGAVTMGYIVGFIGAAALVGWLAERGFDRHPLRTALAMVAGNLIIYAVGVTWLAIAAGTTAGAAIAAGAVPFVLGDLVKIAIATALLPTVWALVRRARS
jgi:biotin transport system substrate-specific component